MNEIAAEELLQHTDFVRRVARAICADEHGAEDLVQETWVTALTRERPDASALRSWLAGVARNLARQGRRGATRRYAREAAAAQQEGQPATDDLVARMETHRRVVSAVLELRESSRRVIVLRYFDGLPPRAIAARLGMPVETVRTRIKRARDRLRATLDEQHGSRKACLVALAEVARDGTLGGSPPAAHPATASATAPVLAKVAVIGALAAIGGVVVWPMLVPPPEDANEIALALQVEPESVDDPTPAPTTRSAAEPSDVRSGAERRPAAALAVAEPTDTERVGVLVVLDVDGTELVGESGELFLRPMSDRGNAPQHEARPVPFRDGRFSLAGVAAGIVQIERAIALRGGERRPIAFENAQFALTAGEPLVVRGSFLRDATLHVVDARTGAPLERVRVLPRQGSPRQRHPGPHTPSSFCVKDRPSPVLLPRRRSVQSYWVTAVGYTWSFLKVDHETGGEREVRLEPAGRLEVNASGYDGDLAIFLRVYAAEAPDGTRRIVASCMLDEGPSFQGFDGLPPGAYDVRAEIGAPEEAPRVLDEARAVVPVGGVAEVFLEPTSDPIPAAVEVHGEIVLPPGHEDLEVSLCIRPAAGPVLRRWDTRDVPFRTMGSSDSTPGALTWYAQSLTPGRYLFVVTPIQYGVLLDVPRTPVDDLRIQVPRLYTVVVRAIDAESGAAVEDARLRWTRDLPADAGTDAWVSFGLEPGRGSATLLVPAGTFFLAGSGPAHGQQFLTSTVVPGANEVTLELPPRIPLEVVLAHGDTVIPWVHGMTCTFRSLGAEELRPCGLFGDGTMRAYVEEPGLYEIAVGALDGFAAPEPVVVAIGDRAPAPIVVQLRK